MNVDCQRCGTRVPVEDVDLGTRLAKCRACQGVFDFSAQIARSGPSATTAAGWPVASFRPPAPLPKGITVVEDGVTPGGEGDYRSAPPTRGRLLMRRSWYSHQLILLALFCAIWDWSLVNLYATGLRGSSRPGWMFFLFPLLHVAVGVGLTYRTLAGFINKTWIDVTDETLIIRHGPLPWLGNRTVPSRDIKQIYCESVTTSRSKGGSTTTFSLSAMLRDGSKVDLLKSLPSAAQALYLEQRIEQRLAIPDERVAGELQA